jgi:NADPH2:quinone reductase
METKPEPTAGHGQAVVDVAVCGVNYIDVYHRSGLYEMPLPFVPGLEGAGMVSSVGEGVANVRPGDRVAWADALGSYADRVVVDADRLLPVPDNLALEAAGAVALQGMTAHYLVHDSYPVRNGDSVLVHAAAGGLGQLLVQMAKRLGAQVIGTVSTAEKERRAREAGADHVIRYGDQDFAEQAKKITGGRGVDVVYDGVGRDTFLPGLTTLRPRGTLVLYGQSSGPVPPFDPQLLNAAGSVFLTRPNLGHYTATRQELLARAGDVFRWLAAGDIRMGTARTYLLERACEAHQDLENRRTTGKLLLAPR